MRRSPRRPLILRRRKLPFFQNEPMASGTQDPPDAPGSKEPSKPVACQYFTDGIRIMDHPSMCDTQVVVIPKTADLQSVIGALTAKGKECGPQGPNKFILLSEDSGSLSQTAAERKSGSRSAAGPPVRGGPISPEAKLLTGIKPLSKDANCSLLDDSLTNIQWLGKMNTCALEPHPAVQMRNKENQIQTSETSQAYNMYTKAEIAQQPMLERPPYSYMAMIQFAINSRKNRKMTLKEIYMWIEDNFPYYREVAKPGWKNSIRHNLSLHDMFVREASPDGKIFFWTIRPEANRCLTLDQVYKQQKKMTMEARKTPTSEKRMKPLLPRTESYLVPIQLPVASTVYLPTSVASFTPASSQQKQSTSRGAKRVRIAPKVTQSNFPAVASSPQRNKDLKMEVKQEPICVPIKCETPKAAPPKRQASSSRRKQRLVHSLHEEPVLLCPNNTFFDSGVASDGSAFQDVRDSELDEHQHTQNSPDRDFSFKTPIKSSSHLTSSTPTKPPLNVVVEPWKVTPVGKGTQTVLEVSPIRTPGGPAVTPRHDYTTFSFGSTPFKDLPLFSSPRELLTHAPTRASTPAESPPRHLPRWGAPTPANRSLTEGLVLDTMNDSLSKILVDISFSGLDDEDLETANISWSEFLNQFK
ncbi:forkhead box protein M1 isoform X2 [Melanotaenia boesemani]|uniref:forkhead box protein M1 isoform X2 n=1 Tax=Melanotaenia boesemani TaxID=1250792 RepID=UPI001C05C41F|nr:forkhead box protein M1 isoform X2 [Melanotaenia boesemani]